MAKYEQRGKKWGCTLEATYNGKWYVAYGIAKLKSKAWSKARKDLNRQLRKARK